MTEAEKLLARWNQERMFQENLQRQQVCKRLLDYYNGDQLAYLEVVLSEQFADPKALKLQKGIDNITEMIINEISRVFDDPPVLTCDNANGKALIEKMTADGKLSLILKQAECQANLTGICAVHPWYDEKRLQIKHKILPAHSLWAIQDTDDPTEAEAIVYQEEIRDTVSALPSRRYTYWDAEQYERFWDGRVKIETGENPYRIMPFAFFRDELPMEGFFNIPSEILINAQDTLNVMLTELNQLLKMQSFSIPVMIGMSDPKNPIIIDPSKPIKIPKNLRDETPPDFKFVTPAAKISELMEAIRVHVERVCHRFGLSPFSVQSQTNYPSGIALKMSMSKIDRRRRDCIPNMKQGIKQWWEIVKRIANVWEGANVPEDAEIQIDIAEPKYDEDPAVSVLTNEKEIALGLRSPVAILMERNPDLDEAGAKALYMQNLQDKKDMTRRFGLADLVSGTTTAGDPNAE